MTRLSSPTTGLLGGLFVLFATASVLGDPTGDGSADSLGHIQIVESWPIETNLDLPAIPDAPDIWLQMIRSARSSIAIETFYFSERPEAPGALAVILTALEEAAERGVLIRALCDAKFYETYPDIPDRLGRLPGAASRLFPARSLWGGVQHAKYFIVDGDQFFLGSQNWDWRALEDIYELGVGVGDPQLTATLQSMFELDWALAGDPIDSREDRPPPAQLPTRLLTGNGDTITARLAASPSGELPTGIPWDEPLLVEMMDTARTELRLQLLSYNPVERDGVFYEVLENGLRRAAARGVTVQIILSNWAKRRTTLPHIQSLAAVPNIEIRFTNIPAWSGGFVPYARVSHAKYLVADSTACWLGTANWSHGYFHESRNISLFLHGRGVAKRVIEFFAKSWNGPYAETVDPCGAYEPPRIGR